MAEVDHRFRIVYAAGHAAGDGFPLQLGDGAGIFPGGDPVFAAAADRAHGAGAGLDLVIAAENLRVQGLPVEVPEAPVVGPVNPEFHPVVHEPAGPVFGGRRDVGVDGDDLQIVLVGFFESFDVGNPHIPGAAGRHGLQVLGPHDGPDPRPGKGAHDAVGEDAGQANFLFAGGADRESPDFPASVGFEQGLVCLHVGLAPQMLGVPDFNPVVVDPEVNGLFGRALDDELVVPGGFQKGAPVSRGMAVAEHFRDGGFGGGRCPAGGGDRRPEKSPRGEDQTVGRIQRRHFGGHLVV